MLTILPNGLSLDENEKGEIICQIKGQETYILSPNHITQSNTLLSANDTQILLHQLLRAEFSIPEEMSIRKFTQIKKNKETNLKIEAQNQNLAININVSIHNSKVKIEKTSSENKKISSGRPAVKKITELAEIDEKNKFFSQNSTDTANIGGDKYSYSTGQTLKRNISSNGQTVNIQTSQFEEDSESPEFFNYKATIEISSSKISELITQNSDRITRKLKITYDLHKNTLLCNLAETEYDAYTSIEYKNTLLTPIFNKKAEIRTLFDRVLKATYEINSTGNIKYQAKETQPDMTEKEFTIENDTTQIPTIILSEVKKIKEIASKATIMQNSQAQSQKTDFSRHASVFDEYAGIPQIKDNPSFKLATTLLETKNNEQNIHLRLLAQISSIQNSQQFAFRPNHER